MPSMSKAIWPSLTRARKLQRLLGDSENRLVNIANLDDSSIQNIQSQDGLRKPQTIVGSTTLLTMDETVLP